MPELWDSLNAAQQPPPAPDMWNAPMGVGSPAETAGAPSLMSLLGKYFAPKTRDENSPVEHTTASPLVNITTQDIADATDKAMAFSGGGLGIKAYHGSPVSDLTTIMASPPTRQFDNATSQFGAFLAPTIQGAERYAGKTGNIYPAEIPAVNPYEMPWHDFNYFQSPHKSSTGESLAGEHWANRAEELKSEAVALRQKLQDAGHDSLIVRRPKGNIYEMASFGDVPVSPHIRAYHSSPHDFDRFDLSKIGTGEGAQVYGHGLYFAENPAVSGQGGQYWSDFQRRFSGPEYQASERLRGAGFDREKAIENVNDRINRAINSGDTNKQFMDEQIKTLQLLESGNPVGPRTYEVNINADPAHFLDWDKAVSAHPEAVRDILARTAWGKEGATAADLAQVSVPGEHAYKRMITEAGGTALPGLSRQSQAIAASDTLREAGIPGIKYLDQGSRGLNPAGIALIERDLAAARAAGNVDKAGVLERELSKLKPSSNYVVFNPNLIDIMKKYGIAGAAPLAAGFGFPPVGNEQRM